MRLGGDAAGRPRHRFSPSPALCQGAQAAACPPHRLSTQSDCDSSMSFTQGSNRRPGEAPACPPLCLAAQSLPPGSAYKHNPRPPIRPTGIIFRPGSTRRAVAGSLAACGGLGASEARPRHVRSANGGLRTTFVERPLAGGLPCKRPPAPLRQNGRRRRLPVPTSVLLLCASGTGIMDNGLLQS